MELLELMKEWLEQARGFLMTLHLLTNFEIGKYDQNKPKFSCLYSRDKWPKIKNNTYVINHDKYQLEETHWIVLYVNSDNETYFDNFGVEHIP